MLQIRTNFVRILNTKKIEFVLLKFILLLYVIFTTFCFLIRICWFYLRLFSFYGQTQIRIRTIDRFRIRSTVVRFVACTGTLRLCTVPAYNIRPYPLLVWKAVHIGSMLITSVSDPDSVVFWIQTRIRNPDPGA